MESNPCSSSLVSRDSAPNTFWKGIDYVVHRYYVVQVARLGKFQLHSTVATVCNYRQICNNCHCRLAVGTVYTCHSLSLCSLLHHRHSSSTVPLEESKGGNCWQGGWGESEGTQQEARCVAQGLSTSAFQNTECRHRKSYWREDVTSERKVNDLSRLYFITSREGVWWNLPMVRCSANNEE